MPIIVLNILSHPVTAMLVMLGSLVLFHELGHYLAGRWTGVAIEKFAIGFGHRIASFRRGQTDYLIGWIPLGGYVKFYGATRNEDIPSDVKGMLYWQAPIWKRMIIVFAGPAANFILAFLIFWILVMHGIEHPPAVVGDVIEGSRAQQAGILPGDRFLKVGSTAIKGWSDIERIFQKNPEVPLPVDIDRQGQSVSTVVTPEGVIGRSLFGSISKIGRVGVALGFPSAVVTISDAQSLLGRDGLKTGDRFEGWKEGGGQFHKINGLHDTFRLFSQWKRSGLMDVQVTVRPITIVDDEGKHTLESSRAQPREIHLNVSQWPDLKTAATLAIESDRAYAASLGALDSHLTVGLVKGASVGVLMPGDRIVSWNGQPLKNIFQLQEIMESWKQPNVGLGIIRDFKLQSIKVPLKAIELQLPEGLTTVYGLDLAMLGQTVMPDYELTQESNPFKAAMLAVDEATNQTVILAKSLWQVVTGVVPVKAMGGPMMIAKVAGDSAKAGWVAFLASMAVISINLGLVNLFPIPVLDGGQLVLLGAESLKRKPIDERTIENFQRVGFAIVMSLVVIVLYNDLSRFWGSMVRSIMQLK